MTMTYAQAFGGAGSAAAGGWTMPITSSKSVTFTELGTVILSVVGAGGGGAVSNGNTTSASGGNSAPWGRKKIKVLPGDVMLFTMAAGGAKAAVVGTNGSPGGTTTVALNGVTILTVQGGENGVYVSGSGLAAQPVTPSSSVTGADYWVLGQRAGSATSVGPAASGGGAAVDVLSNGTGKSPNASGGPGNGGSVGTDAGGIFLSWLALTDWGIAITDPAQANTSVGSPGRGGAVSGSIKGGAFAGEAGSTGLGQAGYGGGGGGGTSVVLASNGGASYAHVTFVPEA